MNSYSLLLFLGQPAESAKPASEFVIYSLPGVYFLCLLELLRKYLATQGVNSLVLNIQTTTLVLHIFLCFVLLSWYDSGLFGIAMIFNINSILNYIIAMLYIWYTKDNLQYQGDNIAKVVKELSCTKSLLTEITKYLRYGLPSALMF